MPQQGRGWRCAVKLREYQARYDRTEKGRARKTAWNAALRTDPMYRASERLKRIRRLRADTINKLDQLQREVESLGIES